MFCASIRTQRKQWFNGIERIHFDSFLYWKSWTILTLSNIFWRYYTVQILQWSVYKRYHTERNVHHFNILYNVYHISNAINSLLHPRKNNKRMRAYIVHLSAINFMLRHPIHVKQFVSLLHIWRKKCPKRAYIAHLSITGYVFFYLIWYFVIQRL